MSCVSCLSFFRWGGGGGGSHFDKGTLNKKRKKGAPLGYQVIGDLGSGLWGYSGFRFRVSEAEGGGGGVWWQLNLGEPKRTCNLLRGLYCIASLGFAEFQGAPAFCWEFILACLLTYLLTYLLTHTHTLLHTHCLLTYLLTYLHTHTLTLFYTHTHTHTHTHTTNPL